MLITPHDVHTRAIGHGTTAVLVESVDRWVWVDQDTRRIWQAAQTNSIPLLIDEVCARGHQRAQVTEAIKATIAHLTAEKLLISHASPDRHARGPRHPQRPTGPGRYRRSTPRRR
jgi:hypothetical protein